MENSEINPTSKTQHSLQLSRNPQEPVNIPHVKSQRKQTRGLIGSLPKNQAWGKGHAQCTTFDGGYHYLAKLLIVTT